MSCQMPKYTESSVFYLIITMLAVCSIIPYNKILKGMLFTPPSHKLKNNLSFSEQRCTVKQKDYTPQELQTAAATFKLTLNVLDLLIDKNPRIADQLFILKRSLSTWYEHTKQESIQKTREILNLRENLVIRVKKEIGIVFEQIAYYLRNIVGEYNDRNIEIYYVKYLNALKNFDWGNSLINYNEYTDAEVQTQNGGSVRAFRTKSTIDSYMQGDSPMNRYQEINMQKYLQTRAENLDLERKNDVFKKLLENKEEENKKLKMEIDKLLLQIDQNKDNHNRYLGQVDKLTKMLDKIRQENDQQEKKEDMLRVSFGNATDQFQKLGSLKYQLRKELDDVEQHLNEAEFNQQKQLQKEKQSYFSNNFKVLEESHDLPTVKKYPQSHQLDLEQDEMYRMLFIQALSIEEEMINPASAIKFNKKQEKRFSITPVVKYETV